MNKIINFKLPHLALNKERIKSTERNLEDFSGIDEKEIIEIDEKYENHATQEPFLEIDQIKRRRPTVYIM